MEGVRMTRMMRPQFKQECLENYKCSCFLWIKSPPLLCVAFMLFSWAITNIAVNLSYIQIYLSQIFNVQLQAFLSKICRTFIKDKKLMKTHPFPEVIDITFAEKSDKTGNWSYLWGSKAFYGVVVIKVVMVVAFLKFQKKISKRFIEKAINDSLPAACWVEMCRSTFCHMEPETQCQRSGSCYHTEER